MVEVAQLAGVSDTTVFNYFKTKVELLDAVIESRSGTRDLAEQVDARPRDEKPFVALRRVLVEAGTPGEALNAAAIKDLTRTVRADPALWGAQLRVGFQTADQLAEAFSRRVRRSLSEQARTAAYAFTASMIVVLEGLPEDCTERDLKRRFNDLLDALSRAWPDLAT